MEREQDESKGKSLEFSMSEVTPVIDSECKKVSEVVPSADPNDSLSEICEDLFESGMSETFEMEKEALSEESQRLAGESDSCVVESRSLENLQSVFSDKDTEGQSDGCKTSNSTGVSLRTEKQGTEMKIQNVENQTSLSDEENVLSKAGKRGAQIELQTSNTKEEIVSLKTGKQGKEMKPQAHKTKDPTSKEEVVSKKAEKKDRTKMQSGESFSNQGNARCKQGENASPAKELTKDQCCQTNCSSDNARNDELKALKEKLAISKKDTETMQRLLEDVRKDYEDLQKSFEKRETETKTDKAFVEQLMKENDEMKKEKAELSRKTSKRESKVSSASDEKARPKSSERKKASLERGSFYSRERPVDSNDLTCPCFAQSLRKIITDVTEDFKDAISVVKLNSVKQSESLGNEIASLKDEYSCSLERKDFEIRALEETIRGLQARIREGEREEADYRNVISSAFEEKKKLFDDIHGLKEELAKAQDENETKRADFERIKLGLKKYCTAEEYEELKRLNFKFSDGRSADGAPARQSDSSEDISELRNKETKSYPVLKKAKKEISKLKKKKEDVENRLQAKISQAGEREKHFSKKLSQALSDLNESESKRAELTESLEQSVDENAKLNVKIEKLVQQTEDLYTKNSLELRTANEKLKLSDASLKLQQVKYDELQEDYERLRNGYNDLKKFLEDMSARERKKIFDDYSDSEDTTEHILKSDSSLRKQLKAEQEKNETFYREIESLRKDINIWKEIAANEEKSTEVHGYLQIENEDLKEEMRDNRAFIKQLVMKKKEHAEIIKKLYAENKSLKLHLSKASEGPATCPFDSDDERDCPESRNDYTTTQEHRVRFDKNGKKENVNQYEFSDEEEDSLCVHFSDDNNDVLQDVNTLRSSLNIT